MAQGPGGPGLAGTDDEKSVLLSHILGNLSGDHKVFFLKM
jgi:hypothetical protein